MSDDITSERLFNVLLQPHFSEKASILGERSNQYAFKVAKDATKAEIKEAVEKLFQVPVVGVTTANVRGKIKRTVHGAHRRKNWKKAYVRIAEGQEIDFLSVE